MKNLTYDKVQQFAAEWNFLPWIDGESRKPVEGATRPNINPANGELLYEVSLCGQAELDQAVSAARKSFELSGWRENRGQIRQISLKKLSDLIMEHREELALADSRDMGKPYREALKVDVPGAADTFRFYAELIDKMAGMLPTVPPGNTAKVERVPLGVVGIIVPWNYPLEILSWKLAPALATGNSVVVKPAMESPSTAIMLAQLAKKAGVPDGVINVVTGAGSSLGKQLAKHTDVDVLAFTGSTNVAKKLMCYAGESNLKRLSLEAGGKSSNLIFSDCHDLELAAEKAAFGAFYNQGEVCSANSRILVQSEVFEQFCELLAKSAQKYLPKDPMDQEAGTGALVSEAHADEVHRAVTRALKIGECITGGNRLCINGVSTYVEPTVVAGVPLDDELHQNEIFGPLALVNSFDTEEEAITAANSTDYGLAASIWTADLRRANRVSDQLLAGTVSVNTVDALSLTTPFGGFKQSGFGRDLSVHAIENYTDYKTTWIDWS